MKLLSKLQNQPEHIRKAIFWLVVILISIFLSVKIIKDFQKRLKNFRGERFKETAQMPSLKEQLEIPKAEIENLKNLLEKINLEKEINPVRNFREIWLDLFSSHKISNGVNEKSNEK